MTFYCDPLKNLFVKRQSINIFVLFLSLLYSRDQGIPADSLEYIGHGTQTSL